MRHLQPRLVGKHLGRHVLRRGGAGGGKGLARACTDIGDQRGQVARRKIGVGNDDQWHQEDVGDGREVAHWVVRQAVHHTRIDPQRAGGADTQRVAIGGGSGGSFHPDDAGAAGPILHHHTLWPALREPLRYQTGEHIRRLAGREGHDHSHRATRVGV